MFGEHPDPCEEEFEPDMCSEFEFPSVEQMDLINNISIESGEPHSLKFLSIKQRGLSDFAGIQVHYNDEIKSKLIKG